ncbi:PstS family phosphate ABC transporter substrate-binding protein [Rhodobium gokarnense]|uniref:Phosphate transport system substrate-binding protein n=1 Tax=Rhodobium gokarnense TaxID=364296 RepID=A0ABT3H7T9_9HYPH|nr:substrate-binding domain-containing protein [Rhodobium gokarnense]MCW2306446.1 phosphate transport system substrate-binding protein [Rhodobium gokarnense]
MPKRCLSRVLTAVAAAALAGVVTTSAVVAAEAKLTIGGTGGALGGMQLLAEAFEATHPDVKVEVLPSLGSGGGIKAVLAGAIDLSVSARGLKDKERAAGAIDRPYARTAVILVTGESAGLEQISGGALADVFVGATGTWPNGTPVRLVLRQKSESDIGFLRKFAKGMDGAVDAAYERDGLLIATNDQQNADYLEKLPGSVGVSTEAQILSEGRRLRIVGVDKPAPNVADVERGAYPHVKTFRFVTKLGAPEKTTAFIAFVRSPEGQEILRNSGHQPVD